VLVTRILSAFIVVAFLLSAPARPASGDPIEPTPGRTDSLSGHRSQQSADNKTVEPAAPAGDKSFAGRGAGDLPTKPQLHYRPDLPEGGCVTGWQPNWYQPLTVFLPVSVLQAIPSCSGAAGRPAPTPLDAAYQAWYWQTTLPDPTLATSPLDGAITGLDLYLSIGGPQTMTIDVTALGYDVHLDISSVYDVRWGDPRPDGTPTGAAVTRDHPTQGGPYPHGDLRHQYIERGRATIEVTQKWTARWSAGGQSGTIADRLSTSASRTIPVQEIQAVLTNSSSP
jgi:hypothetical protein